MDAGRFLFSFWTGQPPLLLVDVDTASFFTGHSCVLVVDAEADEFVVVNHCNGFHGGALVGVAPCSTGHVVSSFEQSEVITHNEAFLLAWNLSYIMMREG